MCTWCRPECNWTHATRTTLGSQFHCGCQSSYSGGQACKESGFAISLAPFSFLDKSFIDLWRECLNITSKHLLLPIRVGYAFRNMRSSHDGRCCAWVYGMTAKGQMPVNNSFLKSTTYTLQLTLCFSSGHLSDRERPMLSWTFFSAHSRWVGTAADVRSLCWETFASSTATLKLLPCDCRDW